MKIEKLTFEFNGRDRLCTVEHGRNYIATDIETGFSGNGKDAAAAIAALIRNLNMPDPRPRK